jgi:hypothetical protein
VVETRNYFAARNRARTHFWIADWYGRAYRATGHAMPLLESLYHYFECLSYTPFARPFSVTDQKVISGYRLRLARRAFYEMLKTLRLGRRSIEFWCQPSEGHGWFSLAPGEAGWRLLEQLENSVIKKLNEDEADPIPGQGWLASLRVELQQLPQMDDADIPLMGYGVSANFSRSNTDVEKVFLKGGPPMFSTSGFALSNESFWLNLKASIEGYARQRR